MGKGPKGGRPSNNTSRPGRAGKGPKPVYRPTSSGGGTKHSGGKTRGSARPANRVIVVSALAFIAFPLGLVTGIGLWILNGHGVI